MQLSLALLMIGCSTITAPHASDCAEMTVTAPENLVRAAVVQILVESGYEVFSVDGAQPVLRTGYREEMDSPWDGLHRSRFGRGRSRVEVSIVPENDHDTRVTIQVSYEGKDSLFSSWQPYVPPLPQSAANQVRLIKNALGLL
jgi:hypothetical protein